MFENGTKSFNTLEIKDKVDIDRIYYMFHKFVTVLIIKFYYYSIIYWKFFHKINIHVKYC